MSTSSTSLPTSVLAAPEPDFVLSPYTGWTRGHWEHLTDSMLLAARSFAGPGNARITFPGAPGGYGTAIDGLEGYARTFMAAGFRLAGAGGHDPLNLAEWYAEGLAAGTDPQNPERWVRPDEHGQAKVEAAAIAVVLSMTRPLIWDRLDDRVQQNVITWFATVIHGEYPPINWVWFRIVVEQFLRSVGGPWSADDIEHDLALHDSFVREGGWYADGAERSYDHYAGWALHLYPVLWLGMTGQLGASSPFGLVPGTDPTAPDRFAAPRREQYLSHLDRFLPDAVRLVGADGAPLAQGRSLIYRFAAAAPLWTAPLADSSTLAPGLVRRATSGIVSHFVDRGSFTHDGVLPLGYHHEWRAMAQSYSGTGSPYWASKGLLGLALPAEHPVWTAVEEPLPLEGGDDARVMRAPGWLVSATRADGIVRVINHGTDHSHEGAEVTDAPLYARLGYSTATFPLVDAEADAHPFDQSVSLLNAAGEPSHRAGFVALDVPSPDAPTLVGASESLAHWVAPEPGAVQHGSGHTGSVSRGASIRVVSAVRGAWEVRFVRVTERAGQEVPTGTLRVGGWPAPDGIESRAIDLGGFTEAATRIDDDATPYDSATATPWLATAGPAEPGRWYAAGLLLTRRGSELDSTDQPHLTLTDDVARITWPDGADEHLDLAEVRAPHPAN